MANAVEESLRFDAPVHGLFRTNTCPVTLHGVDIPVDSKVLMLFGSANRDPDAWDEPDRFDVTRDLQRPEAQLRVRLRHPLLPRRAAGPPGGQLTLDAVLDRLPGLRLDRRAAQCEARVLHGFETYPIAWEALMAYEHLFEPLRIDGVTIPNRIVRTAHGTGSGGRRSHRLPRGAGHGRCRAHHLRDRRGAPDLAVGHPGARRLGAAVLRAGRRRAAPARHEGLPAALARWRGVGQGAGARQLGASDVPNPMVGVVPRRR